MGNSGDFDFFCSFLQPRGTVGTLTFFCSFLPLTPTLWGQPAGKPMAVLIRSRLSHSINRCISTLISFSAFKKDCSSSTSSVCQAGDTHKFSLCVGLTTAPTIYPNIYISGISGIPKYISNLIKPQKPHSVP